MKTRDSQSLKNILVPSDTNDRLIAHATLKIPFSGSVQRAVLEGRKKNPTLKKKEAVDRTRIKVVVARSSSAVNISTEIRRTRNNVN